MSHYGKCEKHGCDMVVVPLEFISIVDCPFCQKESRNLYFAVIGVVFVCIAMIAGFA